MKTFAAHKTCALWIGAVLWLGLATLPELSMAEEGGHGRLGAADYRFIVAAAHDTRMEVALGHIGVQNSKNALVRAYAQRTIDDCQKSLEELTLLAAQKGVSLPVITNPEDKDQFALGALLGADFDLPYINCMVQDDSRAVSLFKTESDDGIDPDLHVWAGRTLPMLQQHLQMAEDIDASLSGTSN